MEISAKYQEVLKKVSNISNYHYNSIYHDLNSLLLYVPYRFLRPWFQRELNGFPDQKINNQIKKLASNNFSNINYLPIYQLHHKNELYIKIQSNWFDYLKKHNKILLDYCYWNLLLYLQKKIPNGPNIAQKLFPPRFRQLIKARNFWDIAISEKIISKCIYSDLKINKNDYSIDHFIPWSFVTHDQLWNLIPVPQKINSAKSDSLPSLERYSKKFS